MAAEAPPPRDPYTTLEAPATFEIERIKNSRFIGEARPITDEGEAAAAIEAVRASMPDARHHCWAWRLQGPERFKSSDDGEPGGSAGRPILAQITGRELFDVVVVVTRYFGGTKLGVGGLMRAYGSAAAHVLDRAVVRTIVPKRDLWIAYDYTETTLVESALRALELEAAESRYEERVTLRLSIPDGDQDDVRAGLSEHTQGRVRFVDDESAD